MDPTKVSVMILSAVCMFALLPLQNKGGILRHSLNFFSGEGKDAGSNPTEVHLSKGQTSFFWKACSYHWKKKYLPLLILLRAKTLNPVWKLLEYQKIAASGCVIKYPITYHDARQYWRDMLSAPRGSRVVPHPSTRRAHCGLASQFHPFILFFFGFDLF
jgi:hypothetical protein